MVIIILVAKLIVVEIVIDRHRIMIIIITQLVMSLNVVKIIIIVMK